MLSTNEPRMRSKKCVRGLRRGVVRRFTKFGRGLKERSERTLVALTRFTTTCGSSNYRRPHPTPAIFVQQWRTALVLLNRSDLRFPATTLAIPPSRIAPYRLRASSAPVFRALPRLVEREARNAFDTRSSFIKHKVVTSCRPLTSHNKQAVKTFHSSAQRIKSTRDA